MTDPQLRRADELLTELAELIETARAVPMSGSCVVPREHTLDLLDDLREALPGEIVEARRIVAERDELLADARQTAASARSEAGDEAGLTVARAKVEAARLIDEAKAENARLISATGVHQAAVEAAEQVRGSAATEAAGTVAEAQDYAARLRADADAWAENTLAEAAATLQRAAAVADRGRAAIAGRRVGTEPAPEPDPAGEQTSRIPAQDRARAPVPDGQPDRRPDG